MYYLCLYIISIFDLKIYNNLPKQRTTFRSQRNQRGKLFLCVCQSILKFLFRLIQEGGASTLFFARIHIILAFQMTTESFSRFSTATHSAINLLRTWMLIRCGHLRTFFSAQPMFRHFHSIKTK